MIRINLFVSRRNRQVRKIRRIHQEAVASLGFLAVTIMLCGVVTWMMNRAISEARQENQTLTATLALLTQQAKDEQVATETLERFQAFRHLSVVLSSKQLLPVYLFKELSRRSAAHALWLDRLEMEGHSVHMNGTALSRKAILQFAESLREAGLFQVVTIQEMRSAPLGEGLGLSFAIRIQLTEGWYDSASFT